MEAARQIPDRRRTVGQWPRYWCFGMCKCSNWVKVINNNNKKKAGRVPLPPAMRPLLPVQFPVAKRCGARIRCAVAQIPLLALASCSMLSVSGSNS